MLLNYPDSEKTSYATLSTNQTKEVYVYASLFYHDANVDQEANVNQYVDIEFVKNDTTYAAALVDVRQETASTATDPVIYAQSKIVVPSIRLRYRVNLSAGDYIVRFILSDPLLLRGLDSGEPNQFKIFISSL
jgi:hypothetical protein